MKGRPTIVFDSQCPMCSRFAHWVIRRDGGAYDVAGREHPAYRSDTVVLLEGSEVYTASDAVLRVLRRCGKPWRVFAAAASLIPRSFRDAVYGVVARHRPLERE